MRLQVEVEFDRVHNVAVYDRAGLAVPALLVGLVLVPWLDGEEPYVVALADHDHGDRWFYAHRLASL